MKKTRPVVDIVKFIKVLKDRETYPNVNEAADAVGMTVNSFKQKMMRERKRYPKVFNDIDSYSDSRSRLVSEGELLEMLAQ